MFATEQKSASRSNEGSPGAVSGAIFLGPAHFARRSFVRRLQHSSTPSRGRLRTRAGPNRNPDRAHVHRDRIAVVQRAHA